LAWQCPLVGTLIEGTTQAVLSHVLQRVRGSELPSLETYALLFGGVTLLHRMGRRDFDRAHDLLQAAADRAPRHPSPQAWLAQWHVLRAQQGWVSNAQETAGRARDCAQRALDADPEDSLALTMDALVHVHFLRRLDEAAALYEKAVTVNPNDSQAWLHKGMLHAFRGQAEAGVNDTERALTLSPLDPMKYYYDSLAASAAATAGRYERAIELAERSLAINCLHTSTLRVLALSQTLNGEVDAARVTVTRLLTLEPDFTVQRFLARAPGADFEVGQRFARALREAGVPE
jgi:adenylate cyclase